MLYLKIVLIGVVVSFFLFPFVNFAFRVFIKFVYPECSRNADGSLDVKNKEYEYIKFWSHEEIWERF